MIKVTIDGKLIKVEKGTTVLHAAQQAGIKIPTLCYLEDVLADGSCRICVVEIERRGRKSIDTSCTAICSDGGIIETMAPAVVESRRQTLDLLLSDHNADCFSCAGNGDCKLQDLCYDYGVYETSYTGEKKARPTKKRAKRDAAFAEVEEKLSQHIGTKVRISGSEVKGQIEIEYYSREELDRLIELLCDEYIQG